MNKKSKIISLIKQKGIVRPCDLKDHGVPREYLLRLTRKGLVERIGRGLYSLPLGLTSEARQLAEVSKKIPNSVICLLSALQFHNLTTQLPHEIWVAIKSPGWKPIIEYPPIHVVWFSKKAYDYGIEVHTVENVQIKVYSVAKTVADCFKYRNKIGLDVAIEALREARQKHKISMDELWKAGVVCRVSRIMLPYMETIE